MLCIRIRFLSSVAGLIEFPVTGMVSIDAPAAMTKDVFCFLFFFHFTELLQFSFRIFIFKKCCWCVFFFFWGGGGGKGGGALVFTVNVIIFLNLTRDHFHHFILSVVLVFFDSLTSTRPPLFLFTNMCYFSHLFVRFSFGLVKLLSSSLTGQFR